MERKNQIIKKLILVIVGTIILFLIIVITNLIIFEKNASVVSKGEIIENYSQAQNALLVIDIQEATTGEVASNSFYKANSDKLIENINRISKNFIQQNRPVVYIRGEITDPLINLLNNSYAKGSLGAQFDRRLKIDSEFEVVKNRNDAFSNTNLDQILCNNKVNELYIVGLDAAYCVNKTIEAAQNRNYKINLIQEAVLSESVVKKDSMMMDFKNRDVDIISIDSLIRKQ